MKAVAVALALLFGMVGICVSADIPSSYGTYISKKDSKEYLTLDPQGTFVLKQRKVPPEMSNPFVELTGRYAISGDDLTLILSDGGEATGKLKGNTFVDSEGTPWIKQGSETFDLQRPKRLKTFK
ncbi:MAG: hypothetical protein AAGU11_18185 [Syntrophobacteraceae bacterium]